MGKGPFKMNGYTYPGTAPTKKVLDEVTVSDKKPNTRRAMTDDELKSRKVVREANTEYFIDNAGTVSTQTTIKNRERP